MNKKVIAVMTTIVIFVLGFLIAFFLIPRSKTFEVKFETSGGTMIESQQVKAETLASKPADPTKPGYTFAGWFLNDVRFDFTTKITEDITLYAMWTKNEPNIPDEGEKEKYVVTFNSNGGSDVESQEVIEGTVAQKPVTPTRKGYTFVAWQLNGKTYDFASPVTKDITLIAKWKQETVETPTVAVKNVTLSKTALELGVGEDYTLKATINPNNATNKKLAWSSTNNKVAKVDANGKVVALSAGSATITVTVGGKSAACKITVVKSAEIDVPVEKLTISKTSLSLIVGETDKLTVSISPTNATNKNVTWSSSNKDVVTVDANGNIKAVGSGNVTITATVDGKKVTSTITVAKPDTYSYKWEKIEGDAAGQSLLFIVKNGTEKVSGVVTITTIKGKTGDYNVTADGIAFVKNAISKVVIKSPK